MPNIASATQPDDLGKIFQAARRFMASSDPKILAQEMQTHQLKPELIHDFHSAFKTLTRQERTYKEYKQAYLRVHLLSGWIADHLPISHPYRPYYQAIANYSRLIYPQVRTPISFMWENIFGKAKDPKTSLCRLKGDYSRYHCHGVLQDPLARQVAFMNPLFVSWNRAVNRSKDTPPFALWLFQHESAAILPRYEPNRVLPALGTKQVCITNDGQVLAGDGEYLYAYKNGTLYLDANDPLIHHDRILGYTPVECAGELVIRDNQITFINNGSGHYKPTPFHLINIVEKMRDRGIFSKDALAEFIYKNKNLKRATTYGEQTAIATMDTEYCRQAFRKAHFYVHAKWQITNSLASYVDEYAYNLEGMHIHIPPSSQYAA